MSWTLAGDSSLSGSGKTLAECGTEQRVFLWVPKCGFLCLCPVCSPFLQRNNGSGKHRNTPDLGVRWGSQTFWSQDPFTLLKIIKDPKELLFM